MKTKSIRVRHAGYAGVATALVVGGVLAGVSPASAAAAMTASEISPVVAGADSQPAGDLTYSFSNNYGTDSSVTFQIGSNDCSTPAGVAKAIGIDVADTLPDGTSVPITKKSGTDPSTPTATLTTAHNTCWTNGIADTFTVKLSPAAATGDSATIYEMSVNGLEYTVGPDAALGNVTVTATGANGLGNASAVNAEVVTTGFTGTMAVAQPDSTGSLGTLTFKESGANAFFDQAKDAEKDLTFELVPGTAPSAGTPTVLTNAADVKAKVTASTGFSVTSAAVAGNVLTVKVKKTATGSPATISVTGLAVTTGGADQFFATTNGSAGKVKVLNVVATDRVNGANRYETAAKAFDRGFGSVQNAVVASGEAFPDALGGGYLARAKNTGLLLTKSKELPKETRLALVDHNVQTVYLLGGETAVSADVAKAITDLQIAVVRVSGANRYETNAEINKTVGATSDTVLVASGVGFADALALGPISYSKGWPLVLTNGTTLTDGDKAQLTALQAKNAVVAGGNTAVSPSVVTELDVAVDKVARVSGDPATGNRYDTATAIAKWATVGLGGTGLLGPGLGFNDNVGLATGLSFADALSAGPLFGLNDQALLLIAPTATTPAVDTYLGGLKLGINPNLNRITAVGGTTVVSGPQIFNAAEAVEK